MKTGLEKLALVSKRKSSWVVLSLVLLSVALHLYVLTIGSNHVPVTSDEAIKVLQAKQIASGTPKLFLWTQPYQFPLQSYMLAPIVNLLPRNGFGARFLSYAIGFCSLALLVAIFMNTDSWRRSWPGLILIMFPTSYLLMIQFGYPMLGYTSSLLMCTLAILLTLFVSRDIAVKKDKLLVATVGFLCGLSFADNMLLLSLAVPIAIVVCWGRGWRQMRAKALIFAAGCLMGLLPYLVGIWRYPEARSAVSGTGSLQYALSRIWSPSMKFTLPRALGVDPPLFPDSHIALGQPQLFATAMGLFYAVVLAVALALSITHFVGALRRKQWPLLSLREIAIGASLLGLLMFAFSKRADSHSCRYLAPVAWCFPFLIYSVWVGSPRYVRHLFAAIAVLLVGFNIYTSLSLTQRWKAPEFGRRVMNAPDLEPAIDFLRDQDIRHCVASHWAAYRINFLTDEEIVCSQPMNERFPGWPLPYKKEVDAATNVAYVLTEDIRFLKPNIFERHMRTMEVSAQHATAGEFEIYYDFARMNPPKGEEIDLTKSETSASNNDSDVGAMVDGSQRTFWRSNVLQREGMWVRIELQRPARIERLLVYRGIYGHDHPAHMDIEKRAGDGWEDIDCSVYDDWADKFRFENGHPVYGAPAVKTYMFDAVATTAIRLRIAEPRKDFAWTITELDLWGRFTD